MGRIAVVVGVLPSAIAWNGLGDGTLVPNLNSSSISGCDCAPVQLYTNERISQSPGCVGGCDGNNFQIHTAGKIVSKLRIWLEWYEGISAISVAYFGETGYHTVGSPGSGSTEIVFKPGETIVGDVTLSGNGIGTNLGYIAFKTSTGQNFAAGENNHDKYYFDSGNSFISGIFGRSGVSINSLAFTFWKPIKSVRYLGITYPSLDSLAKIQTPTLVASQDFCNDNDIARPFAGQTKETDETTGHDSCFEASFSENFGMSVEVKAGIPELAVTATAHWDIGATQDFKNCEQHSKTSSSTITFPSPIMQAHTRTNYQFTQWQGKLSSLDYTATLRLDFQDGTYIDRQETGTYKGTCYMSVQQSWTDMETNVTNCNSKVVV